MKEEIKTRDIKKLNRDSTIYGGLLILLVVITVPLFLYLKVIGIVIWLAFASITLYYAIRIEKQKKTYDIQTYKEIVAFTEGKKLDEIEKNREYGKRPYQKILLAIFAGLITAVIVIVIALLLS